MTDLIEQADQPQVQYSPNTGKPLTQKGLSRLGKKRGPYKLERAKIEQPEDPFIRYIPLTQGQYAVVDTHLYDWLMEFNWYALWDESVHGYYVVRNSSTSNWKKTLISMHKQIMGEGANGGRVRDHANRITTDNRGCNLRFAEPNESASNSVQWINKTSSFRGVSIYEDGIRWKSQISHKGKKMSLGVHTEEVAAAKKYDEAAIRLHGRFAVLNFPELVS